MPISLEELAQLYAPTFQQADAVSGVGGLPEAPQVPHDGNYSASMDFQPQTYDFGNQGAVNFEYDSQGNMQEVLPNKQRISVDTSHRGYSPEKAAQIEAGPNGSAAMARQKRTANDEITQRYAPIKQGMAQANQAQLQAEDDLGAAEGQQIEQQAKHKGRVALMMDDHAKGLERLSQSTLIAKQQAADAYRQRLLEIPEVNPNALWDDAGPGGQFALGVAAFVHDMLGVKGIKTSAMDTINNAIQRKIDAQIANINTKKAVAQGFKDLYDMTVAESASQMEVKAKLQGYYLKAFETGLDAQMGAIDSNVARLKHSQAKAVLRQAQLKNMADVESHIGRELDQAAQRQIQIRGQNLQASIAQDRNKTDLEIAKLRENANKKEADAPTYVYDPETGKSIFKFKKNIKPETAMKKLEEAGKFEAANETMNEIRALERKMEPVIDPIKGTRLAPEDARRYEALVTTLAHQLVAARGERPTDKDVEQQLKALPTNTTFTRGAVNKILADTQRSLSREFHGQMRQFVDDVPVQEQHDSAKGRFAAGSYTDAGLTSSGEDVVTDTAYDTLVKKARTPDALDALLPGNDEDGQYKQFTKPLWEAFTKENPDVKSNQKYKNMHPDLQNLPTKGFDAVRELAEHANAGDPAARTALDELASGALKTSGSENEFTADANVREYARWFQRKLGKGQTLGN